MAGDLHQASRMEQRPLGSSGLAVPAVGMGTWRTFDVHGAAAEENCRQVVDAAFATGATLFDSSPMYGAAEEVLSRTLGDRRDAAIIADKVWTADDGEADAQIARALAWYGGRVDIYQVHNLVAIERRLRTLDRLRARGAVSVVGATHYQHAAFPELVRLIRSGAVGMVQVPLNAADRIAERELLPAAAEHGVGVLVMRPLGEGRLARRAVTDAQLAPLRHFGITTWAQALLKWILSDPRVSCVIPATSRPERMRENALAGDLPWLDADARAYVEQLAAGG
jgi:aryl-alcohol dehydrogenase-like predicted oxidoreductase